MLDYTGKFLPGANTLAYLASSSAMKKKSFITLTPDVYVIKLYFFVADTPPIYASAWACTIKLFTAVIYGFLL